MKKIQAWLAAFLPFMPNSHVFAADLFNKNACQQAAFVISKNWNLGKSASYFKLRKRWKVALVGRGFVC